MPYEVLRHIAAAVLFADHEDSVMALFTSYTAYFDASGHPDENEALTVSGYVSTVKKWCRFVEDWQAILKSEGLSEFHMTDFVSSRGQFSKGWKGQTERRRLLVERLCGCIKSNTNKAFRTTIVLSDYRKLNERFCVEEHVKPYAVCGLMSLYIVKQWARRKGVEKKTLIFFEDGDKDKGNFEENAERLWREKPMFLPKSKAVPFQAADFAGWKVRDAIEGALKAKDPYANGQNRLRSVEVLPSVPSDAGIIQELALVEMCKRFKIPQRVSTKEVLDSNYVANAKGQTAQ